MGSKSISNELLLEWQILSKILRSLWVIDKSTHYLICSRHKSAKSIGMSDKASASVSFLRGDAFRYSWNALYATEEMHLTKNRKKS